MTASSRTFALVAEALDRAGMLRSEDTARAIRGLADELETLGFRAMDVPRRLAEPLPAERVWICPLCYELRPHDHSTDPGKPGIVFRDTDWRCNAHGRDCGDRRPHDHVANPDLPNAIVYRA